MGELRVGFMRVLYRVAWRALQVRSLLWRRRRGNGVKCVLTHRGRVLLVRHSYGRRRTWYLPGGGARRGEPPLRAAEREMREELGVRDLRFRELATWDARLERIAVHLTCLHAELPDPTVVRREPIEIAEVGWFAFDALPARRGSEVPRLVALAAEGGARDRDAG